MSSKFCVLFVGLVACLWGAVASAQGTTGSITAFGFNYTPVENATVALATAGTGIVVGNLGSAGQDGVSITPPQGAGGAWSETPFLLVTSYDLGGTVPTGAFLQQTAMVATASGGNQVVSTITTTQLAGGGASVAADFTPVSNAPLTIDYFSGGPNGTLVYSEQSQGAGVGSFAGSFALAGTDDHGAGAADVGPPDKTHPTGRPTAGVAAPGGFGAITTAGDTVLPASDNIDFIDFLATPTAAGAAFGPYSSVNLTAGGGISSFTITGEMVATPEPSTLALLGVGAVGLLGFAWRRRARRLDDFSLGSVGDCRRPRSY